MHSTLISLVVTLFAALLLLCGLIALVAVLASQVFHVWGTRSALGWSSEAIRRVFTGGLRQRFMRCVNRQSCVCVDGSRRACQYIAVSVSPNDVTALAGRGGSLSAVAADAAKGLARYGRAQGWSDTASQVTVLPENWLRHGTVRARPVSWHEFVELQHEMHAWELANLHPEITTAPGAKGTLGTGIDQHVSTRRLLDSEAPAGIQGDAPTEVLDVPPTVNMTAHKPQIVLADAEGERHEITSDSVRIGRGRTCGVRLDSAGVSREHINVYFQDGIWWLRDWGSRNGTTLDGAQVRGSGPVRLKSRSQIVLGCGKAAPKLTVTDLVET